MGWNISAILRISAMLLPAVCLDATAQSDPAPTPLQDEVAIRLARTTQTKAIADGDLDLVQSYWTQDVTIRRALGQPLDGIVAARKVLEPVPGTNAPAVVYSRESTSIAVSDHWPLAYEEGHWAGYAGDVHNTPAVIDGDYAAQWVKRDGKWLIRSEVFVALHCRAAGCNFKAAP